MKRVFLSVGTNLDREASLARAWELLARRFRLVRASSVYETEPVGPPGQPPFFNLAVELETDLSPEEIRHALRAIEDEMGRVRTGDRYAPRTIDLDLVLVEGGEAHPQSAAEAFVLLPLAEIAPDRVHPHTGRTLGKMARELAPAPGAVRRVAPPPEFPA